MMDMLVADLENLGKQARVIQALKNEQAALKQKYAGEDMALRKARAAATLGNSTPPKPSTEYTKAQARLKELAELIPDSQELFEQAAETARARAVEFYTRANEAAEKSITDEISAATGWTRCRAYAESK